MSWGTLTSAETIYESTDYYDGLGACITEIEKHLTISINVTCGFKGAGVCSGHRMNDYFSCRVGAASSNEPDARSGINWLLNEIYRQS